MDRLCLVVDSLPGKLADDGQLVPLAAVSFYSSNDPENQKDSEDQKAQSQDQDPPEEFHVDLAQHQRQYQTEDSQDDSYNDLQAGEKQRLHRMKFDDPILFLGDGKDYGQHQPQTADEIQDVAEHGPEVRVEVHEARLAAGRA